VNGEQHLSFRADRPLDPAVRGDLERAVADVLNTYGIASSDVRFDGADLDEAFLALTGREAE
jgi:hypothetical protein